MSQIRAVDAKFDAFVNGIQAQENAKADIYEAERISYMNAEIEYLRHCNDETSNRRLMTINQEDRELQIARKRDRDLVSSGNVGKIKKEFRYTGWTPPVFTGENRFSAQEMAVIEEQEAPRNVTFAAQIDTYGGPTVPVTAKPQAYSLQNGNQQRQNSALNPAFSAFVPPKETPSIAGSDVNRRPSIPAPPPPPQNKTRSHSESVLDHALRLSKALPPPQKETPSTSKGDDLSRHSLPTPPVPPQKKTPSIPGSDSSLAVGLSTPPTTPENVTPPSQEWLPAYSPWLPKDHVRISPHYNPTYIHEDDEEKKARKERSRQRSLAWKKWRNGEGEKPGPDPDLHFNWGRKWSDKYWPVRETEEEEYMQQPFETLSYLDL